MEPAKRLRRQGPRHAAPPSDYVGRHQANRSSPACGIQLACDESAHSIGVFGDPNNVGQPSATAVVDPSFVNMVRHAWRQSDVGVKTVVDKRATRDGDDLRAIDIAESAYSQAGGLRPLTAIHIQRECLDPIEKPESFGFERVDRRKITSIPAGD
jgi:hypothetical protein